MRKFLLVLAALGLAGCGHGGAAKRIRLANVQGVLPPYLAESLGFFREEGLDVEISDFGGVAKTVQALVGGSVDVCVGGYDQAIQLAIDGRGVAAFVLIGRRPGAALVVSPKASGRIRRIEDLKGAVAGVTAPGSTAQWYLYYLMQRHGLAPADVSITGIGTMASAVAALDQGSVDAGIVLAYPMAVLQRRHPDLVVLADMNTAEGTRAALGVEDFPNLCLLAPLSWLDREPKTARKVARATVRTLAWIQAHTPEEIRARLPAHARLEDAEAELEYIRRVRNVYSGDGRMPAGAVQTLVRVFSEPLEKFRSVGAGLDRTWVDAFVNPR